MLINWFVSAFAEDHYLRQNLKTSDLRLLAAQFCTHLLAAGVLRQLPDKDVPQAEALFRILPVDLDQFLPESVMDSYPELK
ncbi:Fmn2p [Homalodisca vitripennis]|nr:Fmn2p [Homalodisca vitripennis]